MPSVLVSIPMSCPQCEQKGGLFWDPEDSYLRCKLGQCPFSSRTRYVEISRDSDVRMGARVVLAFMRSRYATSDELERVRARVRALADVVIVESAFLLPPQDGGYRLDVTDAVIEILRDVGIRARRWSASDLWQ